MSTPAVSVVMSVYNGGRHLPNAIESILNQSFNDFEFIIIDDGSTDDSPEALTYYSKRDSRVNVLRHDNRGLIDSLNRGCSLARGEYIARMDADDVAVTDRLLWQMQFMIANPRVAVLGGAAQFINDHGTILCNAQYPCDNKTIQSTLLHTNVFWHPAVLMRKADFHRAGGYRRIQDAEDYDLWLRMAEYGEMANLPQVILKYRVHLAQISVMKCQQQAMGTCMAQAAASLRKNGSPDPLDPRQPITPGFLRGLGISDAHLQTSMARGYLASSRNMCRIGAYEIALDMLERLVSPEFELADRWIAADALLWKAKILWHEDKFLDSLTSGYTAITLWPRMLGRPLKLLLRELKSLAQCILRWLKSAIRLQRYQY
jgi:hypothetical protein